MADTEPVQNPDTHDAVGDGEDEESVRVPFHSCKRDDADIHIRTLTMRDYFLVYTTVFSYPFTTTIP
jgi:hypothetical protein